MMRFADDKVDKMTLEEKTKIVEQAFKDRIKQLREFLDYLEQKGRGSNDSDYCIAQITAKVVHDFVVSDHLAQAIANEVAVLNFKMSEAQLSLSKMH